MPPVTHCDRCGKPILLIGDGWLQWHAVEVEGKMVGNQIEIVHQWGASPQGGCYPEGPGPCYRSRPPGWYDMPLFDFMGPGGIGRLLDLHDQYGIPMTLLQPIVVRLYDPSKADDVDLHLDEQGSIRGGA